jgi:hypothetical protein
MNVVQVDHEWLRQRLGWALTGDEEITRRSISQSGELMGSVYRVSSGQGSFILKTSPAGERAWARFAAGSGAVVREIESYRYLQEAGRTYPRKVAPDCFWWTSSGNSGALALQDLGPAVPSASLMATGLSRVQVLAAVECLALVHAMEARVGGDALSPPFRWLYSASSSWLLEAIRIGIDDLPRIVASRWPKGLPGTRPPSSIRPDISAALIEGHLGAKCLAVCHGDAWASNIHFSSSCGAPGGIIALLLDWQFTMWGNPLSDVALLFKSSLTPSALEAWRDELLTAYHQTLVANCSLEYTPQDCFDDYSRARYAAALVALATLEAYTSGMNAKQLRRFEPRVRDMLNDVAELGAPSSADGFR